MQMFAQIVELAQMFVHQKQLAQLINYTTNKKDLLVYYEQVFFYGLYPDSSSIF